MQKTNRSNPLYKANTGSRKRLLADLRKMIQAARNKTAQTVNAGLVCLYWSIGERIYRHILHKRRAQYGEQIVSALGRQLSLEYGPGFTEKTLRHMIRFAEIYPDAKIVSALSRELAWTHIRQTLYIDDPLKRDFYLELCRVERWSTRTLGKKIGSMLFERTGLSKKPGLLAKQELQALRESDRVTPDLIFRDPYILDFLGLKDVYSERDLENAILRELEGFLLELGAGFTFVARQKRITIDTEDYYLDLLFFHRNLRRLVAIDLKLDNFRAADKGQMELYLRWLEKYERKPGEEAPIGLILCAGKSDKHVELLELEKSGIRVAEYLTELPPRKVLEQKLFDAIRVAHKHVKKSGA
jgi:predicted nuclease of restriction endonuclease-like (RecB) superfamily